MLARQWQIKYLKLFLRHSSSCSNYSAPLKSNFFFLPQTKVFYTYYKTILQLFPSPCPSYSFIWLFIHHQAPLFLVTVFTEQVTT